MNSINVDEIDRLMRVVSEPLRKQWEAKHNDGKSLVELQKARNEAASYIELSYTKSLIHLKWALVYVLLLPVGIIILNRLIYSKETSELVTLVVLAAFTVPIIAFCSRRIKKLDAARRVLEDGDKIFERFQESVHALNPHGIGNTYHDVITADYAYDMLKGLAIRMIDAQVDFDAACKSQRLNRWNITHLGTFIQNAEEKFDNTLSVGVEDFSLPFERKKVFEEARAEYDARVQRRVAGANPQA